MAKTAWPGQDPLGQRVQFGNMDGNLRVFTVVGVVGDIRERGLDSKPRPTLYADYRQRPRMTRDFTIALHATRDAGGLTGPARAVIHELAPDVAPRFRTVDQVFALSVADRRFTLYVLGAFGAAALLLAVLGIYGVLGYVVTQRTQEFGVRMALGASRHDVWRLVLRQAVALVAGGVVLGTAASWGLTRLMSSLLFGITRDRSGDVRGRRLRPVDRRAARLPTAGDARDESGPVDRPSGRVALGKAGRFGRDSRSAPGRLTRRRRPLVSPSPARAAFWNRAAFPALPPPAWSAGACAV